MNIQCANCGEMIECAPYGGYREHLLTCMGSKSESLKERVLAQLKRHEEIERINGVVDEVPPAIEIMGISFKDIKGPKKKTPVTRLIPKGMLGTTDTVLDDLAEQRDDIAEIYVCIKRKDGTSDTYCSGSVGGLAFALLMLQDKALEALNGHS